jgi:biotin carboxyl carrier protein
MNVQEIEEIAALLRDHAVSEISVEQRGSRIHLRKGSAGPKSAPSIELGEFQEAALNFVETDGPIADRSIILASEMVGLFHYATPPVLAGMRIEAGHVVGNVESLRLMNEVVAGAAGQVAEVIIKDGAPVDYGQPLFRLIPPDA